MCREKIKEYIIEFQDVLENIMYNEEISLDLRKYMEAL